MLVLLVAVADLGRFFASAIAIEAGAREAADYGAFSSSRWTAPNRSLTEGEMQRRACTAASAMPDYTEPTGTVGHATCTNPVFAFALERIPAGGDCSAPIDPPFGLPLPFTYDLHAILDAYSMLPNPFVVHLVRESAYVISDLDAP